MCAGVQQLDQLTGADRAGVALCPAPAPAPGPPGTLSVPALSRAHALACAPREVSQLGVAKAAVSLFVPLPQLLARLAHDHAPRLRLFTCRGFQLPRFPFSLARLRLSWSRLTS